MAVTRSRGARARAWAVVLGVSQGVSLGLALGAGAARAQEEAAADSAGGDEGGVPAGFSYGVEATSSYHYANNPYFGADWGITREGAGKTTYSWTEGFTRLRLNYGLPRGAYVSAGGVLLGTGGTDYFGVEDVGDGRVDQLLAGWPDVGGSGLSLVAGRQDLQVGDGFLIGDGYLDRRAALWNIPLNFYDAVRADWARGPWRVLAFGAHLSHSFGSEGVYPKGIEYGGEAGWSAAEDRAVALGVFQRADDGPAQLDARAYSLRGALGLRGFTLAGEGVQEAGTAGAVDLKGRAGHLGLTYGPELRFKPYAEVAYLFFSGDDPATPEDEGFYPWEYRWSDWSRYYVADFVGSTLVFNNDARIWKLECGVTPFADTGVRLLAHRIDLDTGSAWGGLPEGVGRGFADELDLVVDQALGDRWSAWVMGAYVVPREAGKALVGRARAGQLFVSLSYAFDRAGGGAGDD